MKAILVILDGYGEGEAYAYNAVQNSNTPTLRNLKKLSYSLLKTDGESVGLFDGDLGGSEVGHTTIGAGRVVLSTAKKINNEIENGKFEKNKQFLKILSLLKKNNSNLHIFGLMSDKNIHSNINHAYKIINQAQNYAKNIFIHFVADGRDCGPTDSLKYLKDLKKNTKDVLNCEIASVAGRFYAMDRENYLDRTNLAFQKMFLDSTGIKQKDVEKYLKLQHEMGHNDQYIYPTHVETKNDAKISSNDVVLFFNFREDRLRQIVKKCEDLNCTLVTMADVANTKSIVLYPSIIIKNTLSEYLSKNGKTQIKISETTKYAHVTYFLNGGKEQPFTNEDRVHVPTIKTDDYAKTPKMQAKKITYQVIKAIKRGYDAIIVNYSNPDMLGHTGDYEATVKALEFVDVCLKKVLNSANKNGYRVLITADHGNSEYMRTKQNTPHTAHTLNPVFCVVADGECIMKQKGSLKDVAPTFLQLLGMKNSKYFEGESLITKDLKGE